MICDCRNPISCPDTASCVLCGKNARPAQPEAELMVTIPVSDYDALLQYRRRLQYQARQN